MKISYDPEVDALSPAAAGFSELSTLNRLHLTSYFAASSSARIADILSSVGKKPVSV